jgi:hypothetical protein
MEVFSFKKLKEVECKEQYWAQFKYLGMSVANVNLIEEEIKAEFG